MLERKERRDAAEHRRIILQKAQSLFMEHGVNQVSMHQIAKSAGVGQGTLYRRYAHKGDLCLDLVLESYRLLNEKMEKYLSEATETPASQRLERIISDWVDFVEEKYQWIGTIQQSNCHEGLSYFFTSPIYLTMQDRICKLIEEASQEIGNTVLDPVFTTDAIINSTGPSMYQLYREERCYSAEEYKKSLINLCSTLFTNNNGK